jgi:hypothetical protein
MWQTGGPLHWQQQHDGTVPHQHWSQHNQRLQQQWQWQQHHWRQQRCTGDNNLKSTGDNNFDNNFKLAMHR